MYGRNCKYNAIGVFKVHNSVKIFSIVPKIELDLDVIQTDLITKFQLNMFIICEENERKLLVDRPTGSNKVICPSFFEGGHNK